MTVLTNTHTVEENKGVWRSIDAYACYFAPCDEIVAPEPWRVWEETELEICFTIGATLTTVAKADLKVKLLLALGLQVQASWDMELGACYTKRSRQEYSLARSQCYPTDWREVWIKQEITGFVEEALERRTFQVGIGSCIAPLTTVHTYCGYRKTDGLAQDTSALTVQTAPGAGVPLDDPDRWDGRRIHRCCENPPPPADPCCGCWLQS